MGAIGEGLARCHHRFFARDAKLGDRGCAASSRVPAAGALRPHVVRLLPGEAQVTAVFTERSGKTTLTATVLYPSKKVRDIVIKTGTEHGAAETYDKLAEILAVPV